ncbi:HNH endonuclease signature motif containing protein [Nocardioides ungokensis]|uniref:HNH endonuclease signature motif containing protein n=1 Tax=Nocardioides ungokensis TaxID=1643322 RepID=UPI0015E014E3|nr:HNH endonuclease signature motif containing protein [Nocardioides ungokensis]
MELTPAVVRRMACDADLIPVASAPRARFDVGRTSRLVTGDLAGPGLPRPHCAFPGCTRPPVMGHAHHIVHWADHGETSLDNLVLLCGHHHRTIHHTPWQVRLNPTDGKPEFLPPQRPGAPPHLDPHQTARVTRQQPAPTGRT